MKTYKYKVQGVDYEVEITEVEGKIARVNVNGIPFEIEMQKPINAAKHPVLAATSAQRQYPAISLLRPPQHLLLLQHQLLQLSHLLPSLNREGLGVGLPLALAPPSRHHFLAPSMPST